MEKCKDIESFVKNSVNLIKGVLKNNKSQYHIIFGSETMFKSRKDFQNIVDEVAIQMKSKCYSLQTKSIEKKTKDAKKIIFVKDIKVGIPIQELNLKLKEIKKQIDFKDEKIIFCVYNSFIFSHINEKVAGEKRNVDYLEELNSKYGIILLDLVHESTKHIIPADFEQFDFSQLSNEKETSKNKIMWMNMKIYDNDEKSNKKDSKFYGKAPCVDHNFNVGDTVYLAYTNLPGDEKKLLLKGKILHNGYYDENYKFNVIDYKTDNQRKREKPYYPAIYIRIETGLKKSINSTDEYSIENICKKYRVKDEENEEEQQEKEKKSVIRNKLYLSEKQNSELIEELDKAFPKGQDDEILKRYEEYFATKCELEDCTGIKNFKHYTFTRNNGTKYYEKHHLIEQHTKSGSKDLENINDIDSKYNLFDLCSNCHNRIHYGKIEDRKKMVTFLYNKNPEAINELMAKHFEGKYKKGHELEWIYKLYNIEEQ